MQITTLHVRRLFLLLAFVAFVIAMVVALDWVHEPGKVSDVLAFLAMGFVLSTAALVF